MVIKQGWQELADKYLQEKNKQTQNNVVWDKVSKLYSDSAAIKLLNTPELVKEYISKYRLYSESEIKLLTTPELVKEYISKYGINDNIIKIIRKKIQEGNDYETKNI